MVAQRYAIYIFLFYKLSFPIALGKNAVLKRFPAEMAQRMAQFQAMQTGTGTMTPGGQGAARPPRQGAARPPRQGAARPPRQAGQSNAESGTNPNRIGQGGGGMRVGGGNIDDMLERFPSITIADLKVGDMIAVSSTKNAIAERINAIKLLSGVEPFLKAQQQTATGRQRGGQDGGLQIPGLDNSILP